jgi:ribosome-associated translation inhibitor RaiA
MQLEIRARLGMSEGLRSTIERRMAFALGRFGARIAGVTVWLSDVNGPRGGVDKRCRVQVALASGPAVRVEDADADLYAAIGRAAERVGRAVARDLARRRETGGVTLRDLTARATRGIR